MYDVKDSAYVVYGISTDSGAIVVLRPDVIFGYATNIDRPQDVSHHFRGFVKT